MKDGNLQPRAMGRVALTVKASQRGTVLRKLHQSGAFKALFPRARGMQAVLINTAGGLTGATGFRLPLWRKQAASWR